MVEAIETVGTVLLGDCEVLVVVLVVTFVEVMGASGSRQSEFGAKSGTHFKSFEQYT